MLIQTRRICEIIEVEEVNEIIEQGTTMPVRCRLKNGMNVVVKYMRNPAGQNALVNEWIGSNVADIIGLTIPEYGVCNLSQEVIEQTNYNEEVDYRNAGKAFYTKAYTKSIPVFSRSMISSVINPETEKIILFDHLVNNIDRHDGNLLCDISGAPILYSIDNSHIITGEPQMPFSIENALSENEIFSHRILDANREVYDLLCTGVGYSDDKLKQCALDIKERLILSDYDSIKESIPKEWCNSLGKERVDQMFQVLNKRLLLICEIAEMIIEERRRS